MEYIQQQLKMLLSHFGELGVDPNLLDIIANVVGLSVTLLSLLGLFFTLVYKLLKLVRKIYYAMFGKPVPTPEEMIDDLIEKYGKTLDPVEKEAHLALITRLIDRAEKDKDRRFMEAFEEIQKKHPAEAEDILQKIAEEKTEEHEKAAGQASEAYQMIGAFAYFHDTSRAMDAYEKAIKLDPSDPEPSLRYGRLLIRIAEYERARELFNQLHHYAHYARDKRIEAEAYRNLSRIERKQGRLEEASELQIKSLELAKSTRDERGMSRDYNLLGKLFSWRVDQDLSLGFWRQVDMAHYLDQAEDMHHECLKLSEKRGDQIGQAFAYTGLGLVEMQRGNLQNADELVQKSLTLHSEAKHRVGYMKSIIVLGHVQMHLGHLDEAEQLFFKGIAVSDEVGGRGSKAKCYRMLGRVAYAQGDYQTACQRWSIACKLFGDLKLSHWIERTERLMTQTDCHHQQQAIDDTDLMIESA